MEVPSARVKFMTDLIIHYGAYLIRLHTFAPNVNFWRLAKSLQTWPDRLSECRMKVLSRYLISTGPG